MCRIISLLVALSTVLPSAARAAEPSSTSAPSGVSRPDFDVLPFREDWSVFREVPADEPLPFLDRLKYVPLLGDGLVWASFGGQARVRSESWWNFAFGGPGDRSSSFLLSRLRYHVDLHATDFLRAFVEAKHSFSTTRNLPGGSRTLDVDEADLQNGFIDLTVPLPVELGRVTGRIGRQELLFGKQRLVSPLDWSNTRRTFDGFSTTWAASMCSLTAFYTQYVPVRKYEFNTPDSGTEFLGAYATAAVEDLRLEFDGYFLCLLRDASATGVGYNGKAGPEDRYTIGGRVGGSIGETRLDFDVEGAYQFGEVGSADVDAFMVSSELGYRPPEEFAATLAPRLFVGFDYASGDRGSPDKVETFHQLFPLGHAYLGWMDFTGRQNLIDLTTGASVKPLPRLVLRVQYHYFLLAEPEDALYNAGGLVVRTGSPGSSRRVGSELDVRANYSFDRRLTGLIGYSHFFPGRFLSETGSARAMDFVYMGLQYTF